MRVFVAGGSGTIGVPLVRALVASGHEVVAMTRSPESRSSCALSARFRASPMHSTPWVSAQRLHQPVPRM
jgi:nucleoside-diphosphate-sugar epimerase